MMANGVDEVNATCDTNFFTVRRISMLGWDGSVNGALALAFRTWDMMQMSL